MPTVALSRMAKTSGSPAEGRTKEDLTRFVRLAPRRDSL